jgi:hypothetical protein
MQVKVKRRLDPQQATHRGALGSEDTASRAVDAAKALVKHTGHCLWLNKLRLLNSERASTLPAYK